MLTTIKKSISAGIAFILLLTALSMNSFAQGSKVELKVMTYNVSGLPIVGAGQGTNNSFGFIKAGIVGGFINNSGYDIVGVQEDFNFHPFLAAKTTNYPYASIFHGGVPYGDGLNVFSKYPIYNLKRQPWRTAEGVYNDKSDQLAQKGFLKTVFEIRDGVYINLYVLHADAGQDEKSLKARADNYKQLCEDIGSDTSGRAVIIIGDLNYVFWRNLSDDLYKNLLQPTGLRDIWAELNHGGDYTMDEGEYETAPEPKEQHDRILFRSGDGVSITPVKFENIEYTDKDGKTCTNHFAVGATLEITIDNPPANSEDMKTETVNPVTEAARRIQVLFSTLVLLLKSIPELF